jgi:hypothetical protein
MIFTRHTIPNGSRALAQLVRTLFSAQPALADSDVALTRLERCEACRHYAARERQCRLCTCYVDVKTLLASEKCPDKRWGVQTKFSNGL